MKSQSQRGIALVITLIMLSVITFLTVAFLAVSRRDRTSVTSALNQTDSHLMADTALERFRVELVSGMIARDDLRNYDLMLTRNYINPFGFFAGNTNLTNVNYDFKNDGSAFANNDRIFNIANLFYDPRPPVFIKTNDNTTLPLDFRFYLDYNRNSRFETNGFLPIVVDDTGKTNGLFANFIGEPEWIGVLQNPERPHSPTNRFIGRYLYLALPIGKTLDWNYIHNYAKGNLSQPNAMNLGDGFLRNQGFGSWELNLASFLVDLNTNMYVQNAITPYAYFPDVTSGSTANRGDAFNDALSLLRYRYNFKFKNLFTVANMFPGNGATAFKNDLIDGYTTRPVLVTPFVNLVDPDSNPNDLTVAPWSGSDNVNRFLEPQELFDSNKTSYAFVTNLLGTTSRTNSYDRYTFSRLLEQIGMGSEPEVAGKININYANPNNLDTNNLQYRNVNTNFVEWTPIQFFTNTVAKLIQQNLIHPTNANGTLNTNLTYLFNTTNQANLVHPGFSYTNIEIYPTNEYTAQLHRLLQVAANIYDATTTNKFPTVFRPQFGIGANGTNIVSYTVETNGLFITNMLTSGIQERSAISDMNGLVWGVPLVMGAKKGFPNFNKFVLQTSVQISRNLQITKTDTGPTPVFTATNEMLMAGISNVFGLEFWNSYTNSYPGTVKIILTNDFSIVVTNELGNVIWPLTLPRTNYGFATNVIQDFHVSPNLWPPAPYLNAFVLPVGTNYFPFLPNSEYSVSQGTFRPGVTNFETTTDYSNPSWGIAMTNRLVCMILDITDLANQQLIDFVNLDGMSSGMDITKELLGQAYNSPVTGGSSSSRVEGVWKTNRIDGTSNTKVPTVGMRNQIFFSMDNPQLPDSDWSSYSPTSPIGIQRDRAADNFRRFMGLSRIHSSDQTMPPVTSAQTPFNPTRKIDQTAIWEVNDPLVHYTVQDLKDSTNDIVNIVRNPPTNPPPPLELVKLSKRYRPWGGNHAPKSNGLTDEGDNYEMRMKDPGVRWSDDWDFPTNKFPSIGWLGRVHRGTPWQTIYLKAGVMDSTNWFKWAGHEESHPTNDWKLMDLFTTSPNDNAARGLLSINQTNQAAWSAVLSGTIVLSNNIANPNAGSTPQFTNFVIAPNSPELVRLVNDINGTRLTNFGGTFQSLGQILATPSLSYGRMDQFVTNGVFVKTNQIDTASPFLNISSSNQKLYGLTDEAAERIPRQVMSLLKLGEPRFVVYCYGQSLKPANNSLVLSAPAGSGLFNLCTNYQITGEVLTRTVLRVEPNPDAQHPKTVIESYNVLPE